MMSASTQSTLIAKRQKPAQRKGPQPKTPAQDNQPRTPHTPFKPPVSKNPVKQQVRIPGHRG